jgi:DNA repair exonuclease SbcCD nuclease subunit
MHPRSGDHPSFHIREDHLSCLDYDYIALGHWEQQTRVAAGGLLAAYSGAPDGLASVIGESGRVLVVDFEREGAVRLTSHPLEEGRGVLVHEQIPFLEGC